MRVAVDGAYPYDGAVRIELSLSEDAAFPIHLHIPAWAEGATAAVGGDVTDCAPGGFATLSRQWHDGDVILLNLPMRPRLTRWYHASAAVERGPLVFALALDEHWTELDAHGPMPDLAASTSSPWNYALLADADVEEELDPAQAGAFGEGCPAALYVQAAPVLDWTMQEGSCQQPPIAPPVDRARAARVRLVPYGATALRISQFPLA